MGKCPNCKKEMICPDCDSDEIEEMGRDRARDNAEGRREAHD